MIQRVFARFPLLAFIIACLLLAACNSKPTSIGGVGRLALQGNYLWACGGQYVYRIDLRDNSFESFSIPCDHLFVASNEWVWAYWKNRLSVYEGSDWNDFTHLILGGHSDNGINFVAQTRDGKIWISSSQLSQYDPTNNKLSVVVPSIVNPPATPAPVPGEWAVTLPSPGNIGPVFEDTDGAIWYNQQFDGIVRWNSTTGEKKIWGQDDGFQGYKPIPRKFLQTHDGSIWVGTFTGVYRLIDNTWQTWNFSGDNSENLLQDMGDLAVVDLLEDHDHNVWVIFSRYGVMMWNGSNWRLVGNFKSASIPLSLFEDSMGTIWIGSGQHDVTKVERGVLKEYSGIRIGHFLETLDHQLFGSGSNLLLYNRQLDRWEPYVAK